MFWTLRCGLLNAVDSKVWFTECCCRHCLCGSVQSVRAVCVYVFYFGLCLINGLMMEMKRFSLFIPRYA